jgi:tetratricopeptide (TPR) repeat protein
MQSTLATALEHHQSGRLDQAAQLYHQILAQEPEQADALHLLGVAALQQGNAQRGVELIGRGIAVNPSNAVFHANQGEAYRLLGQLDRAANCCRTAQRLNPNMPEAANTLGLVLLQQGEPGAAIDQFRAALRLQPDSASAHNNLGNAFRMLGDKTQALACFRRAVAVDPNLYLARSNLGQMLLEERQLQEALEHCQEAVRLRPGFAEAQNNLGNVLRELGRLSDAKSAYAEALRLNPDLAMVHNNVGQALQEEGKLEEAVTWYARAIRMQPGAARFHTNLGSDLVEQELYDDGLAEYQEALRLDPQYAEAHNGVGFVHHEQGRFEEAKKWYLQAIGLKPELAAAHCNLGTVQEEMGDFDTAVATFRDVLRHDPGHSGALAALATSLRGKLPEPDLATMHGLLADPLVSEGKRCGLHFGLAQALDARGDYAAAAEHLNKANALDLTIRERRGRVYDPALHTRFVDRLLATFTHEFFAKVRDWGSASVQPIFIFGLPRSGTTLVEQILASHSQVHGAGELRLGREDFEALASAGSEGSPIAGPRQGTELEREEQAFLALASLERKTVQCLGELHLAELRKLNAGAAHVADKMPDNYLFLGLLATIFPQATFIHCRRDLRDVAVSCWMTAFRHINWANGQEQIAARFLDYRRLMTHWREVLPVPVLEVDYEETVADLEGVARRLVSACRLEWEPACLAFHRTRRPVRTASVTQVRQPIYTRSVARWKHYEPALGRLFACFE